MIVANFVFQGASALALDAKGRLSVPARHRDVLMATAQGQLTITKHPEGCLMVFPRPAWESFRDKIATFRRAFKSFPGRCRRPAPGLRQQVVGDPLHPGVGPVRPAPVRPRQRVPRRRTQALAPEDGRGVETGPGRVVQVERVGNAERISDLTCRDV